MSSSPPTPEPGPSDRLDSWKEIAAYLKRGVRTVRRWEESEKMPVHRHAHGERGSVYAYKAELDAWWLSRRAGVEQARTEPPPSPLRRNQTAVMAAVTGAALLAIGGWIFTREPSMPQRPTRISPLITEPGVASHPDISPDGTRLAYSWRTWPAFEVRLKVIGAESSLRLTDGFAPAWSPDGSRIAFLRAAPQGKHTVHVIPALGGAEQTVGELDLGYRDVVGRYLTWMPDGKWLIASDGEPSPGLVLLSVTTGEKRRLTPPAAAALGGDYSPSLSPAADQVAFVRLVSFSVADVYRLRLARDLRPTGEPERMTFFNRVTIAPTWSEDGRALLFSAAEADRGRRLWRLPLTGKRTPAPMDAYGENVRDVAIRGNRAVYSRLQTRANIWALDLQGAAPVRTFPLIVSTASQLNPQYSPDATRIAFQSDRSGALEIWVSDQDGGHCRQLTSLGAEVSGYPRWSPDGKQIVFHSRPEGEARIYIVAADGGPPRKLTSGPNNDCCPSWSRDGKTIYFSSTRGGGPDQVWKIPVDGGAATQMTKGRGWHPMESPDGRFIYYLRGPRLSENRDADLWKLALDSGEEIMVHQRVIEFAEAAGGIYVARPDALDFLQFSTGQVTRIYDFNSEIGTGLAVSPDGGRVLYTQGQPQRDLILVEGIR